MKMRIAYIKTPIGMRWSIINGDTKAASFMEVMTYVEQLNKVKL